MDSADVNQRVSAWLHTEGGQVLLDRVTLEYWRSDPYAVTVCIAENGDEGVTVRWTFARALLASGRITHVGEADVRVWPCDEQPGWLFVSLRRLDQDRGALLRFQVAQVTRFLDRTLDLVRWGEESTHLDIDGTLGQILGSAA